MEELSAREVVNAVDGDLLQGDPKTVVSGVSTDTRFLKPNEVFFALKGEKSDGHQYIEAAIKYGASAIVFSDKNAIPAGCSTALIKVEDTLWALGDLAKYYRSKFNVKVVGVTGSVGKTTTKEMLASILERKWNILKNPVNYNNEIGVPLTLFQLNKKHEIVILELAMRGLGEIRRLATIAKPSVGMITNVGMSHIERLGSQGAIADAKAELLAELPSDGLAILNVEDGYCLMMRDRFDVKIIGFGSCKNADIVGARIQHAGGGKYKFVILTDDGAVEVKMKVLGHHNIYNALAAAAAAYGMGVDLPTIRDGLENFEPPAMRMELVKSKAGYSVLNDAYNASPASMFGALKTLCSLTGYKRKVAILGDMLELGDYGPKAHKEVGVEVAEQGIDMLITVGNLAKGIAEGAINSGFPESAIQSYENSFAASRKLKEQITKGDAVLVKGSRGIKMEEIVKGLLND